MKRCPVCNRDLDIDEFGICRPRKDGRNLYCKECIREKVKQHRRLKKTYRQAQKSLLEQPDRKPLVMSPVPRITTIDKVRIAIERGARTREEIKDASCLDWDEVTDALAILAFDQRTIQLQKVNSEARFYPVRIPA